MPQTTHLLTFRAGIRLRNSRAPSQAESIELCLRNQGSSTGSISSRGGHFRQPGYSVWAGDVLVLRSGAWNRGSGFGGEQGGTVTQDVTAIPKLKPLPCEVRTARGRCVAISEARLGFGKSGSDGLEAPDPELPPCPLRGCWGRFGRGAPSSRLQSRGLVVPASRFFRGRPAQ